MLRHDQIRSAVDVVEEAYVNAAEAPSRWVRLVAEALRPALEDGSGLFGWCYDARDLSSLKLKHVTLLDVDEHLLFSAIERSHGDDRISAEMKRQHYLTPAGPVSCSVGRQRDSFLSNWDEFIGPLGIADLLVVNAMNFGFRGCSFSAPQRLRLDPHPVRDALLARVAAHLSTAYRLCGHLEETGETAPTEAVLTPGGVVAHAVGRAKERVAREALSQAVRAAELARGKMRRLDPAASLSTWRSMVDGRWTLVDEFEADGKRYVVARVNEPVRTGLPRLSPRESQVVALASVGHANKLIAYDLGVSEGTVARTLSRARRKHGVRSTGELIARVHAGEAPGRIAQDGDGVT